MWITKKRRSRCWQLLFYTRENNVKKRLINTLFTAFPGIEDR